MDIADALARLEAAGTEQNRKVYRRHGAQEPLFGVSFAVIKALAKEAKLDGTLALHGGRPGGGDGGGNRTRHSMNGALIAIGIRNPTLRAAAEILAGRIGSVHVDHGQTGCVTPAAVPYIAKAWDRRATKPEAARVTR